MKINKVTTGFVIQTYDTETGEWEGQEFIAGEVGYEDENENSLSHEQLIESGFRKHVKATEEPEPYLNFEMKQPEDME